MFRILSLMTALCTISTVKCDEPFWQVSPCSSRNCQIVDGGRCVLATTHGQGVHCIWKVLKPLILVTQKYDFDNNAGIYYFQYDGASSKMSYKTPHGTRMKMGNEFVFTAMDRSSAQSLKVCAAGKWQQGEPSGCSTACGLAEGDSGKPGEVKCSTPQCDPYTKKPTPKLCPRTANCSTTLPPFTATTTTSSSNATTTNTLSPLLVTGIVVGTGLGVAAAVTVTCCCVSGSAVGANAISIPLVAGAGASFGTIATAAVVSAAMLVRKYNLRPSDRDSKASPTLKSMLRQEPINGLKAQPLVGLQHAVDTFTHGTATIEGHGFTPHEANTLKFQLKQCLKWSVDPARPPDPDHMTPDMAAAIMLYTCETCLYKRLNAALRNLDFERLDPLFPYLKLLLTGLYNLPLQRAMTYRGVKRDCHLDYDGVGTRPFTWWSFNSTSFDEAVARSAPFLGDSGKRVLFSIDGMGVDVTLFSTHAEERELLLLPGSKMRISESASVAHGPGADDTLWEYNLISISADAQNIDFSHPHWNTRRLHSSEKPTNIPSN